jgi:hypothetical protein
VAPGGSAPEWLAVVKSVAFWAVAAVGVVYVVRSYLRDRPELAKALMMIKPLHAARRLLAALWCQLARLAGVVRERIPGQLHRGSRVRGRDQAPASGAAGLPAR